MTRLKDLIDKYASNVIQDGTDKETHHSYGCQYEKIFALLEKKTDVKILENGVFAGAFTQVMREYFPDAEIYGIDININKYAFPTDIPNIHLYGMDGTLQSTAEFINQEFDLIIEDASHLPEHQKQSLDVFATYLKKDGIYVIEDIPSHNTELKEDLKNIGLKHNLQMEWVDLRHIKNRLDNILAIFTHM